MKHYKLWLLTLATIVLLLSCMRPDGDRGTERQRQDGYNIIVIDGCQYIEVDEGGFDSRVYSLTHKGNCNNPIHQKQ